MIEDIQIVKATGLMINYYYVCKRKLWLFYNKISFENQSDRVILGKVIHENSFKNLEGKEILIDDLIKIDIVNKNNIHEIKLSDKMHTATTMQLAYYLYYLKQLGVNKEGVINYPLQKKRFTLKLDKNLEYQIEETIKDIQNIVKLKKPPNPEKKDYCKSCAYFEFCFVE
ncbi:MAG: CRISPR-associated protein Cas4 [Hydrogenothermaceae bacterium]|nr:CRISPR-associated protein Cas4 [Hydrogenothermaceae bacterium]